jgi:hypothetical protein
VVLLTELGLDTGYEPGDTARHFRPLGRAGLEKDIRADDCPYFVKTPWFCDHAEEIISRDDVAIDHVLIPMRDLHAAAESRRHVTTAAHANTTIPQKRAERMPGGVWRTRSLEPGVQEDVLLRMLYDLFLALSGTDIPVTLLRYPLLVNDPRYLFARLQPILGDIGYETFEAAFQRAVRPDLVHSFNNNDR